MQLEFIKSNWLRQYPFRYNQGVLDLNNNPVPLDLVVGLRLTCYSTDLEVFINKIYTYHNNVSISFAGNNGDIGYAKGTLTDDNQSLTIFNYAGGTVGNVMFGNLSTSTASRTLIFDNTVGMVEPSVIIALPRPNVTSLNIKSQQYTGDVILASKTLTINTGSVIALSVINPSDIQSRGDEQARYLTCVNNVISGINTVIPDVNGNIDIYAIAPLEISTETINSITQLQFTTPGLGLNQSGDANLCAITNIPPVNDSDNYTIPFTDITVNTDPEFYSWPQYNNE